MEAAEKFSTELGTAVACRAFGVPRASLYRRRQRGADPAPPRPRAPSHRALGEAERGQVLDLLHSERFVDQAPTQVCAALLDEDRYLCSVRTMYRILDANQEVRERRNQRRHPVYQKPELLATGPNEVWTWDITKLKGPRKWTYYYLYVILDIFSRQVVGWMVADCESASLAKKLGSSAEVVGKTVFHRRLRRPRCSPSLKASLASSAAAPALTLGCAPRCRLVWAMGNGASGGGSGHRV